MQLITICRRRYENANQEVGIVHFENIMDHPEPEAFFGSSSSLASGLDAVSFSSGSRLSCWCVSLCQADFKNPSFLWSEALFDGWDGLLSLVGSLYER